MKQRIILHIDMDYFFAQIEERENPQFRGKLVVVCTSTPLSVHPSQNIEVIPEEDLNMGIQRSANPELVEGWRADPKGGRGRGVVSTANYEARKYGIHSAMPISRAYQLCPHAIFLPVNGELYSKVSENIMKIVRKFSPVAEQVSLDEAYLDVSFLKSYEKAKQLAEQLKEEILQSEKLACTVGIGPNKMIAKIACEKAKPDGLLVVEPERVEKFLEPLDIEDIPGIGPKTASRLKEFMKKDTLTVKDLQTIKEKDLVELFGVGGHEIYERARGIDESPVTTEEIIKSVGKEHTFERDTRDPEQIFAVFDEIIKELIRILEEERWSFRTITVVCRFKGFETHTKSKTVKEPTGDRRILQKEAIRLLLRFITENLKPIRLVGVRVAVVPKIR